MARYRGPRMKKCRAVGMVLPGLVGWGKAVTRAHPPGQHGQRRRGKPSDYKIRLVEKQRMRWHYGVMERQFKRYVKEASRRRGPTGENLAALLESRLDNVVWRLGLAPTIPAARQLVVHGHILVDGRRVDRPSYLTRPGQVISVRPQSLKKDFIREQIDQGPHNLPGYLEITDPAKGEAKVVDVPKREDLPVDFNLQAIIEYYSQQL